MQTDQSFRVVIPARYRSTRFPGKPLEKIAGKEMVLHVYEKAMQSAADEVIVATDDQRIFDVVEKAGANVCLTSADHCTGTDRLVEVVKKLKWSESTVIVNVQGDEPLIPVACINQVAVNLIENNEAVMATLAAPISEREEFEDPNVVKVIFNAHGMAMYFSRSGIPHYRDVGFSPSCQSYRHIGIYAYRAGYLANYPLPGACEIEDAEKLEQLRVIHNGDMIHVDIATELPGPGVDTPAQLALVKTIMNANLTDIEI